MFDMMFYPMRMHGFKDTPAQIHRQKKMIEFWRNYLYSPENFIAINY